MRAVRAPARWRVIAGMKVVSCREEYVGVQKVRNGLKVEHREAGRFARLRIGLKFEQRVK
jgi:hypothetical protein